MNRTQKFHCRRNRAARGVRKALKRGDHWVATTPHRRLCKSTTNRSTSSFHDGAHGNKALLRHGVRWTEPKNCGLCLMPRLPIISYTNQPSPIRTTRGYHSRTTLCLCPSGYVAFALNATKLKPRRLASETIMTGLWPGFVLYTGRTDRQTLGRWSERLVYLNGIRLVGG